MEASTGIEPVYADLQSNPAPKDNNDLGAKKYQDIPKTKAEPDTRRKASYLAKLITPAHKSMSRVFGYCLHLGDSTSWLKFIKIAKARLTEEERGALAFAALKSLSPELAQLTVEHAFQSAGYPLPPLMGDMDEARYWASNASRGELKAYALAAFEALSTSDQMAFRKFTGEVTI